MSKHKDFIEINGKKYDPKTGDLMTDESSSSPTIVSSVQEQIKVTVTSHTKPTDSTNNAANSTPVRKKVLNGTPKPVNIHRKSTQKSSILMRKAVRKPEKSKVNITVTHIKDEKQLKKASAKIDPRRLDRSKALPKSPMVNKFTDKKLSPAVEKKVERIEVVSSPKNDHSESTGAHTSRTSSAQREHTSTQKVAAYHTNNNTASISHRKNSHLENALSKASAHNHPRLAKHTTRHKIAKKLNVSSKALSLATGSMAAILLVGFFAFQNVPNMSMRVAAAKSGVNGAVMPGYHPSGFSMNGPIEYSEGIVKVSFRSNSDSRGYKVIQENSNLNSIDLTDNSVALADGNYQTINDKGRTIYIYGNSNATWVDGGKLYRIEGGNSQLTGEQISRIVDSM